MPPSASENTWAGKRAQVEAAGFGFLVLFNGRRDAELKKSGDAEALGRSDAQRAIEAARREGFLPATVIFLDLEEGGRMLPEQKAYIYAWVDGVIESGFRGGVYCSGIPAHEGRGVTVVTANDIQEHAGGRSIMYWVANDACPPSPGCAVPTKRLSPRQSGVQVAEVWQYAQSPRRPGVAEHCPAHYAADGNCYAAGMSGEASGFVDLDVALSDDPSHGRTNSGAPRARD